MNELRDVYERDHKGKLCPKWSKWKPRQQAELDRLNRLEVTSHEETTLHGNSLATQNAFVIKKLQALSNERLLEVLTELRDSKSSEQNATFARVFQGEDVDLSLTENSNEEESFCDLSIGSFWTLEEEEVAPDAARAGNDDEETQEAVPASARNADMLEEDFGSETSSEPPFDGDELQEENEFSSDRRDGVEEATEESADEDEIERDFADQDQGNDGVNNEEGTESIGKAPAIKFAEFKTGNNGKQMLGQEMLERGHSCSQNVKLNELKRMLKKIVGSEKTFTPKSAVVRDFCESLDASN